MYPNIIIGRLVLSSWYMALITGAIVSLSLVIYLRPKDFALNRIEISCLSLALIAAGLLGSRLLFMILHSKTIPFRISDIFSYRLGFAYFGALVLSVLTIWGYAALKRKSFLKLLDFYVPFLMLSQAFIRIGCLAGGCCYGRPSGNFPGLIFRTVDRIPRHATQLYESLLLVLIYILGRYLYEKIRAREGSVSFLSIALYGAGRFFIEGLRTDSPAIFYSFTLAQGACLVLVILAGTAFIRLRKKPC